MNYTYLKRLKKFDIPPNFWCSEEYFNKAGWDEVLTGNDETCWVYDSLTKECMLPPITKEGQFLYIPMWTDLQRMYYTVFMDYEFLDYEYIYDPLDFTTMKGKKWSVFRKNSSKFPKRVGQPLNYLHIKENEFNVEIVHVFNEWLKNKDPKEVIHDDDVLIEYLLNGKNRALLIGVNGIVYGINIWDQNYKYTNYRYCICLPMNYLSEYMRLQFYLNMSINSNNRLLVNDGGVLDNPKLKKFKDKMNPKQINKRYTWKNNG